MDVVSLTSHTRAVNQCVVALDAAILAVLPPSSPHLSKSDHAPNYA